MADIRVGFTSTGLQGLMQKSGSLLRGLGFLAVLAFGVNAISLSWSGQLVFSTVAGLWPGADLAMILLLAMVLSLFHAYSYAIIGVTVPRSGADYLLAAKVLSKPLAFASSWIMVIVSGIMGGSLIASIPQTTLPMFFKTLAIITHDRQYITLAETVATPENVVLIGTVMVVLVFLSLIFSRRGMVHLLQFGAFLGLVAWGIIYYQLISVPVNFFPNAWNSYMGSGDYLDRIIQARALGMNYSFDMRGTTLAGLVLGAWIFNGYFISTYFAGEVKKPERNLLWGSLISLLLTFSIFIYGVFLLLRLVPSEWLAAESYLYLSPEYKGEAMPWITFYAAILKPNLLLIWIVGIAWVFTMFNLGQTFVFYISRIILAWSEDDMMPHIVSFIHPKMNSPVLAVLIAAILAELGVVNASLRIGMTGQLDFVLFVVLAQAIPVIAITLLPFIKRDWFEAASPLVRLKLGPLPVISIIGLITLLYMGWLVVANIIFPAMGGVKTSSIITLVALLISGLGWFYGRRSFLKDHSPEPQLQPGPSSAD